MSELSTKYDHKSVEKGRYKEWVDQGYFKSGDLNKEPFCIVIPPPNVTGKLHIGHAWDNTLQDIIIRRKRMMGFDTLYLPGMDHAGIATQAKVDERLKKQGISRYDLGREKFLEIAWAWKDEYAVHIKNQWAALGVSVDYEKERFTLDDDLNKAVNHVFIELYKKGYIYRGNRIINWDVQAKTALSNIEVEYQETKGHLYYFRYPLTDGSGYLVIATTRPETMFADQALMVHPKDERFKSYVGKTVFIPGTKKDIPVITDEYVDMTFGTGVVKVTPAHDPNDFEVALRHELDMPLCMTETGHMNHLAHQYDGQERFLCRKNLVEDLKHAGLVEKVEDYIHNVGYSERTGVMVEPRLSLQWFVKMDDLAKKALDQSEAAFYPARFKKIFNHWMHDIQDWCISRQLWWGHRIPAWYKGDDVIVSEKSPGEGYIQDEDVLDTWFSSALWPFTTLGWPEDTEDFKRYYPTSVMVTGYDIIFFWVARMIFQGLEFTHKDPFKDVLIHGLIRDDKGRKMSKSLDNGVDPMDIIETYGVDALRYFLSTNSAPGADMRFEMEKVESSWNFINKLWNITRFITLNVSDKTQTIKGDLTDVDRYILARLNEVIIEADYNYEKYEFGEASRAIYNFMWDDFASWYVEFAKIALKDSKTNSNTQAILIHVLRTILKLLHPFIPFVTEKLYQEISDEPSLMISAWPQSSPVDHKAITRFESLKEIITNVRNLRSAYDVAPSKPLDIHIKVENEKILAYLNHQKIYLEKFLNTAFLELNQGVPKFDEMILRVTKDAAIHVNQAGLIDKEKERQDLLLNKEKLENEIIRSESLLNNPQFLNKAPQEKIEAEKEKYQTYKHQLESIEEKLKDVS